LTTSSSTNVPLSVKKLLNSLDPEHEVVRIIRDNAPRLVLHVRLQDRECLVKILNGFWLKRPGRYLRFQKEIFIYSQLEQMDFVSFHYPGLLRTDGRTFILTEFIINDPSLPRDDAFFYTAAMDAVLELNTCEFPFWKSGGAGWMWEKANRWKFSGSAKTLRNLIEGLCIRRKLPYFLLPGMLAFWVRSMAAASGIKKPLLMHRDIFKSNILRPDAEHVYVVDFEKMGLEKRWVFKDALKIAQADPLFFDGKENKLSGFPRFNGQLLEHYWKNLVRRRADIQPDREYFRLQLKFCLLGWTLKKLVKENPSLEMQQGLVRFIKSVILGPDKNFEKWFAELPRLQD